MRTRRSFLLGVLLLASAGCARPYVPYSAQTGSGLGGALANLAIGATAAGISRANGGCYASCPTGTTCNAASGLCEPVACRNACTTDQVCDQVTQQCVKAGAPVDLGVRNNYQPLSTDYWDRAQPSSAVAPSPPP